MCSGAGAGYAIGMASATADTRRRANGSPQAKEYARHARQRVARRRDRASEELPKDPALLSPAARGYAAYPGGHAEGYPDTFVQLFRDFYGYLDAGDFEAPRHFPTFATGNHELILCDAIAKSARERAWIPVLWE